MRKDSVCTQRRAKSGDPSGWQASAFVRRYITVLSLCRCSNISSGLPNSVRIQQLCQHPELEVVALVRRSRQQQQVARMVLQRLGQLVVLGLSDLAAGAVGGQVVGFVEHHQIPTRRIQQTLDTRRALQGVDAGDQAVVLGEGIGLAVGDVALRAEHLEVEVEDLIEFAVPVVHEPGRHHHQRSLEFATTGQFPQDERSFDGLAQPDLVCDQIASRRRGGNAVGQHHLVREQVDFGGGQRRRAFHHWQRMGLVRQPRLARSIRATIHRTQDALRA